MELKEGMYVRTKYGISKIDEDRRIEFGIINPVVDIVKKEAIIKASNNIIDLIEVGDYVNGYKITTINDMSPVIYAEDKQGYLIETITKENIKSIVTKEQFESMSYKVGD